MNDRFWPKADIRINRDSMHKASDGRIHTPQTPPLRPRISGVADDQKGHLRVYPRVGGFSEPERDECVSWQVEPPIGTTPQQQQQLE